MWNGEEYCQSESLFESVVQHRVYLTSTQVCKGEFDEDTVQEEGTV